MSGKEKKIEGELKGVIYFFAAVIANGMHLYKCKWVRKVRGHQAVGASDLALLLVH